MPGARPRCFVRVGIDAGDEGRFRSIWQEMLALIEREGRAVPNDELFGSDVIFPPRDVTFDEAQRDFTGDGLLPD